MSLQPQTSGCKAAYHCGRDYAASGGTDADLRLALSFCDNAEEEQWFLIGMHQERGELLTIVVKQ